MSAVERFLCIASCETGGDFLRQCAEMGIRTTVLTLDRCRNAAWPRGVLEDLAAMPEGLNREQILNTVSWMARGRRFDRVIALDEGDIETAAQIREHMRIPGMGTTTAGCYRDRLAMRIIPSAFGLPVPGYCRVLNYDELREFMGRVPAPWLLKPRVRLAGRDTRRIDAQEHLWRVLDDLGDAQSRYLLEQAMAGEQYLADAIVCDGEVKFQVAYECATSPMLESATATASLVDRGSREWKVLSALNSAVAPSMGMVRGVTHARYVRANSDGRWYFLEISAGVAPPGSFGSPQAAAGLNMWREWARLEVLELRGLTYVAPREN